jgi:hypothetical protein
MALELWYMLFRPGSRCVIYSYNEDEAKKAITRAWLMFNSLPAALRDHVEVITPSRSEEPAEFIKVRHKESGLISSIQALPATKKAGTATRSRSRSWTRLPTRTTQADLQGHPPGDGARQRAPGADLDGERRRQPETGEGSYFHVLYVDEAEKGIGFAFAPWNAEPTRDDEWYRAWR